MNYCEQSGDEGDDSEVRPRKKNKARLIQSDSDADDNHDADGSDIETESDNMEDVEFEPHKSPSRYMSADQLDVGIDSLFDEGTNDLSVQFPGSADDADWEELFKTLETFQQPDEGQAPIEHGDVLRRLVDTNAQVLVNEWIPKTKARQVSCELSDLPDLEQVCKVHLLLVFDPLQGYLWFPNLDKGFHTDNVGGVLIIGTTQLDSSFISA